MEETAKFNNITEALELNARLYNDEVALVEVDFRSTETGTHKRREMTWGEFNRTANRFADLLLSGGIGRSTKIAVLLTNSIEWLPVYFGILKSGAIAVPINYRYTADEIRYCLEKADCSSVVFGSEFTARMTEIHESLSGVSSMYFIGDECPSFACEYYGAISGFSEANPDVAVNSDDDAAIYFSSGTTGFPKAILHTHRSLVHAALTEKAHHFQTHDDVFLCIPPLYHTGAKMHWFGSLLVGGKAVLLKGAKPEWILQTISDEHCSIVWLLVPWAQDILDAIENGSVDLSSYELSQWRLMHIGAQPVPPSLIKRWFSVFPSHDYDTNYGLSESIGPGCVHLGIENTHKIGSIGKAGYGWKTKIVDKDGEPVKQGEVGELCVHGPGVMKCYYNDEEATADAIRDGWLYTGDMVKEDEDGFIYLVDRKKDVIISGGENIYPIQIENHIRCYDSVKDVAVIGLPDNRLGEIVCAIIETKPNHILSEEEINEYCLQLPRYKRPRKIIFASVPRNPTGKIEKTKLREKYGNKDFLC